MIQSMDTRAIIHEIANDRQPIDVLAAVVPELMRQGDRLLPEAVACVFACECWRRWGYTDPWAYCSAVGVPVPVFQQAVVIALEHASEANALGSRIGPAACAMIKNLAASRPEAMSPAAFGAKVKRIAAAAGGGHLHGL